MITHRYLQENTNTGGQRSGSGNMPQDRRKDEEAGKKTGQQSQGGSSQDWQRDKAGSERGGSSGSAEEHDRMKNPGRAGAEQSSGHSAQSGQSGQSKRPDQSNNPSK